MTEVVERAGSISRSPARRSRSRWVVAALLPLVLAAIAVLALGVAGVRNDSMAPTLHGGDVVMFDRWSVPGRGDVVLLVDREGWSGTQDALLVKRVVGVAGDVVVCCDTASGRLIVNDETLDEPYIDVQRPGGAIPFRVSVPDGTVWVMGDNRAASADSRLSVMTHSRGAVAREHLRGVVRAWWSQAIEGP